MALNFPSTFTSLAISSPVSQLIGNVLDNVIEIFFVDFVLCINFFEDYFLTLFVFTYHFAASANFSSDETSDVMFIPPTFLLTTER